MKKTHKNIIIVILILMLGYIAFNFERLFIMPKYRMPIIDNMIDPTSTLFKNEKNHGELLCGEFNSKNRMGAYTGFSRFISTPYLALTTTGVLEIDESNFSYWDKFRGLSSSVAELQFQIIINRLLRVDKVSYDKHTLVWEEYHAKKFADYANDEEYEKAKSTFEETKFEILWSSICEGK